MEQGHSKQVKHTETNYKKMEQGHSKQVKHTDTNNKNAYHLQLFQNLPPLALPLEASSGHPAKKNYARYLCIYIHFHPTPHSPNDTNRQKINYKRRLVLRIARKA
jgi:hypothetical protein